MAKLDQYFIKGDCARSKITNKLPKEKWNIVLALNVFHLWNPEEIEATLKLIKDNLAD